MIQFVEKLSTKSPGGCRSNLCGRKHRGRTFSSNCRDRVECGRIFSYLLYDSVASLPSPSSNIEAWPYGTSLRSCIQGTRGMWTYLTTLLKFLSELFRSHSKIWYVDLRTNSEIPIPFLRPISAHLGPVWRILQTSFLQTGPNSCQV